MKLSENSLFSLSDIYCYLRV